MKKVYIFFIDKKDGLVFINRKTGAVISNIPELNEGNFVISSNTKFIIAQKNTIISIDALTREEEWKVTVKNEIFSSPVIENGNVFFGCKGGFIYGLDLESGEELYSYKSVEKYPILNVIDGIVYVRGYYSGNLYALRKI